MVICLKLHTICTLTQHAIKIVILILFTDKKTHRRFLKIKIDALSLFFAYYLKGLFVQMHEISW
jgi:hypothetical protein